MKQKIKIAHATCCGADHREQQLGCLSVSANADWEDHSAVVLVSGASNHERADEIANMIAQSTLTLLGLWGRTWLQNEAAPEEISSVVLASCRSVLTEHGILPKEQTYTLQFCLVAANGSYYCGNLGGYRFSITHQEARDLDDEATGRGAFEIVSIGDEDASRHLYTSSGRLKKNESIVLCNTGMGEALYDSGVSDCEKSLLRMATWMSLYDTHEMSRVMEIAMNNAFIMNTDKDMSIAFITNAPD